MKPLIEPTAEEVSSQTILSDDELMAYMRQFERWPAPYTPTGLLDWRLQAWQIRASLKAGEIVEPKEPYPPPF